tara:strand:- start:34403 stop:36361 length:1959 start_codon:yes stop_codon:yes gene_type:complete
MAIEDEVLAGIVGKELDSARAWRNSDLAKQQADNLRYYNALPFGNEKKGHSQVVTRDVQETVEGIMPELMKIFTGSDSAVEFEPQNAEDEEGAQQATDYVNYVFMRRLSGFKLLYNWFKDALLMKDSVVKVGWASEDTVEFHSFDGLTDDDLVLIESEDSVEIVDEEKNDDGTFRVRVRRDVTEGQPYIEHIPAEEFRIRERSRDIKTSQFVAHVAEKTIGEMIEAGFDRDDLHESSISTGLPDTQVQNARFAEPLEGQARPLDTATTSEDATIEVADAYIRTFDEDEERVVLMHVIYTSNKILMQEEVDHIPFISISPIMMPHKHTGVAVADLVRDVQEIRSTLYRQTLDNLALQNAGRYSVVEGQANIQDLLDNKIGGVVRTKVQGAVTRLDTPQLSAHTMPMLEQLDIQKENRTGVSRMTQGLDGNALTSNTAATAVNQVMTAAQSKILLIARVFAETGVKELMWELYEQIRTHQTSEDIVKLRGRFVSVSPFDWADRKDMTVTVGIGNGNKDQQLYHLNNMSQMFQQLGNTPYGYLISPDNAYALAVEFVKNSGFKNVDKFITSPDQAQPPEPQPDPLMIAAEGEAAKDQADARNKEAQIQLDADKLQLDRDKFEWDKRMDAAGMEVKVAEANVKVQPKETQQRSEEV